MKKQTTPTNHNVKFNPSAGSAFGNEAFGKGSVILQITADNFDTIMKNLQVGSALLFRYNKETVKGNGHYFAEILPPKGGNVSVPIKKAVNDLD